MKTKKVHPHGLPHLTDATTDAELLAGAAAWTNAVQNGDYTFTHKDEFAVDDDNDILILHRQRVKK